MSPLNRKSASLAAFAVCWLSVAPAAAIVGGREESGPAREGAIMVLSSRGGVCSAIVVAPDAVLTAGHCVAGGSEIRVHYRGPDGSPVLLRPAARSVHPGYVANAVASRRPSVDLALVRLAEPLSTPFRAAALGAGAPRAGAPLTVGGYGVAAPGDARSSGTFRTAALATVEPYGPSRILLWASGRNAGACEGDSGGPMSDEAGAVVAVTSWAAGAGGRGCGGMTQGVLVGPQRGWLDGILASWGRTAEWR